MSDFVEFKDKSQDERDPREVLRWMADKPVKNALIIILTDDGKGEVSVCNGTPALLTVAMETVMQLVGPGGTAGANRADRRRRGRGR